MMIGSQPSGSWVTAVEISECTGQYDRAFCSHINTPSDVPLLELCILYLFACQVRSLLLCLCDVFRALINFLEC